MSPNHIGNVAIPFAIGEKPPAMNGKRFSSSMSPSSSPLSTSVLMTTTGAMISAVRPRSRSERSPNANRSAISGISMTYQFMSAYIVTTKNVFSSLMTSKPFIATNSVNTATITREAILPNASLRMSYIVLSGLRRASSSTNVRSINSKAIQASITI